MVSDNVNAKSLGGLKSMTNDVLDAERLDSVSGLDPRLLATFPDLTLKQSEVLHYVADNYTSKEIAWELRISESAVNQRIEAVRARCGGMPRAEIARAYRQYLRYCEDTCNPLPENIPQVPKSPAPPPILPQDERAEPFALSDAVSYTVTAPWQKHLDTDCIVPEVLDGAHAELNRTAAMVAIAIGMLLVASAGLGVVQALTELV